MSSPAGLQYSQAAEFLARWMPSSSRAGVILNPCPDLAGSLRHIPAVGSQPLEPDDSFASDFAPLPASADSSCLGVDGFARSPGGERAGADRPVNGLSSVAQRNSDGELDSLDEMTSKSQDLSLMMKLEQLRKWQQHMQEQLKAHQLEELLRLQKEQQRLLGRMNGSEDCTGDHTDSSGLSRAEWRENSLQEAYHYTESLNSPTISCTGVPQGSTSGQEQEHSPAGKQERLARGQDYEEVENEKDGTRNSREDDEEQSGDTSQFHEHDDTFIPSNSVALAEDYSRKGVEVFHDRPIMPGIGGQKKTFDELLEEQLRLEEQRLKSARQQQSQDGAVAVQAPPKRAFLKRGEGLSRFTNNRKASLPKTEVKKDPKPQQPQARVICRSNSEPAAIQRGGTNSVQRLPVQRKTATLNKENRLKDVSLPAQDIRVDNKAARMKVLGSHQRQNTEGPESVQTDPEGRPTKQVGKVMAQNNRKVGLSAQAVRNPGPNTQPNPVTKQVGMLRGPEKAEGDDAACGSGVESGGGGDGVPQDSFELSFQEKLQRWECDRQVENMELGEFELLEQAAEELSFSSNSSFVMKVLQMDKLQAAMGLHPRRLSSTPIKSPPRGALQRCYSVGSSGGLAYKGSSMNSEAGVMKIRDDALRNKVSVEDKEEQDSGREDEHESSAVSSCGGSEFEDQEVAGNPPFPSTHCFPAQSNQPYDKRSYQDEDSCRDSDVTQVDDGETDSILSNTDESTLIEEKDGQQGRVVFDDNDTWNDLEDIAVGTASDCRGVCPVSKATVNGVSPPQRTLLRKVAVSKVVELDKGTVIGSANQEPVAHPPASQLMTKLFPLLKPKAQNAPLPPPPAASVAPESKKPEEETGQQVQSRLLRERLVELEIEIERFRKENAALTKLRQENEKTQENLRKERLEFEKMKSEELAKFEEHKKEENRKLQKERKLFEKHVAAARAIPDKKEREEIQALKQQLSSLQEELRGRESRWASTHSRLRQQIDSLNEENSSLRDEIHMLEKLRLSAWKKNPVNAEKDKETKDVPRIFENSVPPVTKGVKFASPLDSRAGSSISPPLSSTAASKWSSREVSQGATAGIKSSLRKPPGPGRSSTSSSSSSPGRRTEERSAPASKSQDKPPNQEHWHNCSLKGDSPPIEPDCSEAEEPESAQVITHPDGKIEKVLAGGDRLIAFPNGTRKEVSADGLTVKVTFFNGDTKQITADQRVIYYYAEAQTTHITYPDGVEVLHFPNNQTEKHFPDGRKEITFPDQTVKNLFPNGREESVLTDGTIIQVNPDGTKEIHFNTGQKEIHAADYKKREYPDGTVKTVYTDGRQETRYPNGRLRIKDKDGNVILDNRA
ncbi:centromere protein J isoform X2 [Micropterus dolomieu]|uniref:centromere protein J isoform X1 n=1 Tax=Micropterus dolomieu TaxID=147949 RepID=UPI001E8D4C32|nr:centromere protein J isoform X1 [Micropterus dolomieu]XP_045910596.1 centromere protein J isoform X2 [Micropterus dolomieu]